MSSIQANIRPRVLVQKCTHIKRKLMGQGQISVSLNQEVTPADILGKYTMSTGFSSVNLVKNLGASAEEGLKLLQKPLGSTIFKGELVAEKNTLLGKKILTSPTDGILEEYNQTTGDLKIKFLTKQVSLTSGVFGIIDHVDSIKGEILIKTVVTQIFGLAGSGEERGGALMVLQSSSNIVDSSSLTDKMSQHIIATGNLIYGRAIKKAINLKINGIITGGINGLDYQAIAGTLNPNISKGGDVNISLLVTEGFGPLPIGQDIMQQLIENEGKFVFINGNLRVLLLPSMDPDSILILRKTVLPVNISQDLLPETQIGEMRVGSKVRLVWPPYMGSQGIVMAIDKLPTTLETGITTILILVETASRKIKVPFSNVELI